MSRVWLSTNAVDEEALSTFSVNFQVTSGRLPKKREELLWLAFGLRNTNLVRRD